MSVSRMFHFARKHYGQTGGGASWWSFPGVHEVPGLNAQYCNITGKQHMLMFVHVGGGGGHLLYFHFSHGIF